MRIKRLGLIMLILGSLLSGCWDRKELNQLAIITGLGVDWEAERRKVKISAEVIIPSKMQNTQGNGGSGSDNAVLLAKGEGDTMFQAIRRTTFTTTRRLNLTHNKVILFSEALAREGLYPILDLLIRDPEPRPTQWVLITEDKPDAILEVKPKLERTTATMINNLMLNANATSEVYPVNLQRFMKMLVHKTTGAALPMIKIIGKEDEKKLQISGLAVFKHDRMVGKLNPDETRGLLWVINEVQSGIVVVDLSEDQQLGMEIIKASAAIKPRLVGGLPEADLQIKVLCNLGEQLTESETLSLASLEKKLEETVSREIRTTLARARSFKTDIFRLGEQFELKYPKVWKKMKTDWERHFMAVKINIIVNADVRFTGELQHSLAVF